MARIRAIKPDFFRSEDVSALPLRARLTWIGLWTHCDDHGRTKDNLKLIKADVWPLDNITLREIEEDLATLADQGRIVRYQVDAKRYLAVVNWHAHQSINRPGKPKHPAPPTPLGSADPDDPNHCALCAVPGTGTPTHDRLAPAGHCAPEPRETTDTTTTHGALTEDSVKPHGALTPGKEGKGKEGRGRAHTHAHARDATPAPTDPAFLPPTKPNDPKTSAPPDRCPHHTDDPNPPPCGPCADARRAHERWERQQTADATQRQAERARERADAARAAINACHHCDHRGYLPTGQLCHHNPDNPDRATRGAAAARAQLQREKNTNE